MATPNYGYEKRQRELVKKRKKEDKLKAKADRKLSGTLGDTSSEGSAEPGGGNTIRNAPLQP